MPCHSPPLEGCRQVGGGRGRERSAEADVVAAVRAGGGAPAGLAAVRPGEGAPGSERGALGTAEGLHVEHGCHVVHLLSMGRRNGRLIGRSGVAAARASSTPAAPVPRSIERRASWSPTNASRPAYGT